jgi:hypothetical protein
MGWESILINFAISTIDTFLTAALSVKSISSAVMPSLLKIYSNLTLILQMSGYDTSANPPVLLSSETAPPVTITLNPLPPKIAIPVAPLPAAKMVK